LGSLSREEVERYKQLFLDAIRQYETDVVEQDRQSKPYLDDVRYSLVPTLKEKVTSGKEIPSDELRFLSEVLQEYHGRLTKLKGKPWVRQATIEAQLEQFGELVRNDIVRLKSGEPIVKFGQR
jgi:siroheme synthase